MIVDIKEHECVDAPDKFSKYELIEFDKLFKEGNKKYLGLHQEFQDSKIVLKSYYYIGYRWLDEEKEEFIRIAPKKYNNNKQADYLKMFLECLKDPIVSNHLDETYKIFFNEKWINIDDKQDEITPFLILHFLKIVSFISKKGLKKGYIKVQENLTSKIKGRILISKTIKQNFFKNRPDRTVCEHQIFTTDCIENQILKTALLQCGRHLHGIGDDDISKLLKHNLKSFELVSQKEIFDSDFAKIKHSAFYKEYKEALKLAQMIFKRFGFALNSSRQNASRKIPPFYINMSELFERYTEVYLRKIYKDKLLPGYGMGNGFKTSVGELRPDFIVENEKLIIDAKYKYWFDNNNNKYFKDDFQQLSLYGRVKEIREIIGLKDSNEIAKILFIYPKTDGKKCIDENNFKDIFKDIKVEGFKNICKIGISIPHNKEIPNDPI